MERYTIIRFYAPHTGRESEVQKTGLTLDEAQAHCRRDDTRQDGEWFDGYTVETEWN